jgi:hypothetical protein
MSGFLIISDPEERMPVDKPRCGREKALVHRPNI